MSDTVRLDSFLVQQGYASGREKAKELLAAGYVTVDGRIVTKAATHIGENHVVCCAAPAAKYVGRGGYKLEKALEIASLSLTDCVCMDVGASTGGFTDCMLQHGAARVYAVDVGHDQLHPTLREDAWVVCLEGTDVRSDRLRQTVSEGSVDIVSVDVSFVSLEHVMPAILPYLASDGVCVCLIKPQFEAGKSAIGKHGVVKDAKVHIRVLERMLSVFYQWHLNVKAITFSPITGGEGNIEYLAVLGGDSTVAVDVQKLVAQAFAALK